MVNKKRSANNYKKLIRILIKEKSLYLFLGLTVLIVGYFSLKAFFPSKKSSVSENLKKSPKTEELKKFKVKTYLTQKGDYLWKIAEETYGSGYNAYDIALANKISNPNIIYTGMYLILPDIKPKIPTKGEIAPIMTQQVTLTASKYTVQTGDYLWKIALAAYGDGFAWVRLAKANNLVNPDIINPGQQLAIPR